MGDRAARTQGGRRAAGRRRPYTVALAALLLLALVVPGVAAGQGAPVSPGGDGPPQLGVDATGYCTGSGGPLGAATDLEHNVLVGDGPLPPGVRTNRVTVGGVSTRIQEAGPPDAQDAVVFVHGSPGSSRDWDDLVAANGAFARTVSLDISGYGKSDKGAREIQTTDGAARYIQGVLERLGIRRTVLVLHDFGGPWGLDWAIAHPEALTGAVLIDTGVLIDYLPHPTATAYSSPLVGEATMASTTRENFAGFIQGQNPRLPRRFVDRMYDDFDRDTRCAVLRYYRDAARSFQSRGRDQAAVLRRRPRPALVIWGENDPYIPVEQAQRQREAFPSARIETFAGAGHWPFIEEPARTRDLVVGFLRPRLGAVPPRVRAGQHRIGVRVRVDGVLPGQRVEARLERVDAAAGRRARPAALAGSSRPTVVSGSRTLAVRLRRGLRPGRYLLTVRALGLPTRRLPLRVRAAGSRREPRFTG